MTTMKYRYFIILLHMLLMFFELNGSQNLKGDVTQHKNWPLLNHGTSCGRRIWEYPEDKVPSPRVDTRILGGATAEKNEFPWVVSVQAVVKINDTFMLGSLCGGSVINHRYVLTAAHCCNFSHPDLIPVGYIIGLSDDNVERPEKLWKAIEKITIHENYDRVLKNYTIPQNDICLVRLKEPLTFSATIQPICLPVEREWETKDLTGTMMTAVGWGVTNPDPQVFPKSLQKVSLHVAPIAGCIKEWKEYIVGHPMEVNPQKQLCAGSRMEHICGGDSGGPLMYRSLNSTDGVPRYYVIGLASFAMLCKRAHRLENAVLVKVSHYIPWILDNIHE